MSNLIIFTNNNRLGNLIECILKCIATHLNSHTYVIEITKRADGIVFEAIDSEDKCHICGIRIYYTEEHILKESELNGKKIHVYAKEKFNNFEINNIFNKNILKRSLSNYLKLKFTDFNEDELCESVYILNSNGYLSLHGTIGSSGKDIYSDDVFNDMNYKNNKNNMQAACFRLCTYKNLNIEQLNNFLKSNKY